MKLLNIFILLFWLKLEKQRESKTGRETEEEWQREIEKQMESGKEINPYIVQANIKYLHGTFALEKFYQIFEFWMVHTHTHSDHMIVKFQKIYSKHLIICEYRRPCPSLQRPDSSICPPQALHFLMRTLAEC